MSDIHHRGDSFKLYGLKANQYSSNGAYLFIFAYVFASVMGAIFTPLSYWFVEYLYSLYPDSEDLKWLVGKGIDIFYDRARWVFVILALPVVFKKCNLYSLTSLNLNITKHTAKCFLKYFILGVLLMSFIFLMQIIFTKVKVESISVKDFLSVLWQSIIGALILGFLEELIFRGLILRCFYTAWGAFLGISLSSAFFAYKHFKVPGVIWNSIDLHTAHWYSGFTVAYYDAIGIFMTFNLLEFLSLFLFGSYLCTIYVTTKTLYSSIAFHFAAVLTIMLHRSIFSPDMSDSLRIFFGGTGATNSYLAVILLSIMILLQLFFDKKSRE